MKCAICSKNIKETFLKKPLGTIIKDEKGKQHYICSECQKRLNTKENILKEIS
ncbi:hypothetical protein GF336_07525 [Candidatus Woesearchaeota archaeon]|nr:hypothetical protein [Candidatus Woesearchaeota archaeon]